MESEHSSLAEQALRVGEALLAGKLTLSVAESCTGGMIGEAMTTPPGASAHFRGGVIAYDNGIKKDILAVPESILQEKGAVSAETVVAMAKGIQNLLKTDCAISVSGIAGPTGGTAEKPVGLVYIGIAVGAAVTAHRQVFKGNRDTVRVQATGEALSLLLAKIKDQTPGQLRHIG